MVFQTLDEIKAQLLIEPDLTLLHSHLGDNLYFLEINEKEGNPDFIEDYPSKVLKVKNHDAWVIELQTKKDFLNLLYDSSFHFDYSKFSKTIRYK